MDELLNQGEEVDRTEEQYSFSDEEEDEVIMEQTNHKKGAVLHTIKSKLKIIKYEKEHSKKMHQLNMIYLQQLFMIG